MQANHLNGVQLEKYMLVITHHMRTDLMDCQPKVLYELLQSFGQNESEIKDTLKLLILVLNVDGQGTEKIKLTPDGKLIFSQGETKANFNFENIWQRYQQAKQTIAEQTQAKATEKTTGI